MALFNSVKPFSSFVSLHMHYTVLHTSSIVVKRLSLTIGGDTIRRNKILFRVEDKSDATFGSEYVLHQQQHRGYCFVQKKVKFPCCHTFLLTSQWTTAVGSQVILLTCSRYLTMKCGTTKDEWGKVLEFFSFLDTFASRLTKQLV